METEAQEQADEKILKPKRTRTMTEEAKKQYAERMRKVNEDRCEKARLLNEATLNAKEKEIQMKTQAKLEQVAKKKEQIKAIREKEEKPLPSPSPSPSAEVKEEPKPKKKTKQVIVYESSSSDQEDDDSSSEDEIIYVAKKPSKKNAKETIVKPKKQKEVSVRESAPIEAPKTIIKFL
jgi:hypothetical protein